MLFLGCQGRSTSDQPIPSPDKVFDTARTVRVVRDGKVVATVTYFRSSSGWFGDVIDTCAGF
jgi:hypothetical protein